MTSLDQFRFDIADFFYAWGEIEEHSYLAADDFIEKVLAPARTNPERRNAILELIGYEVREGYGEFEDSGGWYADNAWGDRKPTAPYDDLVPVLVLRARGEKTTP